MIRQRAFVRQTVLLLLLSVACALTCRAQSPAGDTVYRFHGTVIDGITGKPLARALVKSADQRLATMTGTDGKFAIDISVPPRPSEAGSNRSLIRSSSGAFFSAQKPGYLPSQSQFTLIPLDDTLSSTSFELKLMPAASLTGHVSSVASDSAAGVRITLLLHQINDGQFFWTPAGYQMTNAHGDFHFPNLNPGEYAVLTNQWRGDLPLTPRGAIGQRYPPTFYGDVRNLSSSPRIHLHYGDTTATEIHLHPVTFYPIRVPVVAGTPPVPVNARIVGTDNYGGYQLQYNRDDGAVEAFLPGGDYTLLLSTTSQGPQQATALLPIHVESAPVKTAAVALAPAVTVEVRVHLEFTKPEDTNTVGSFSGRLQPGSEARIRVQPPPVQLLLRSDDSGAGFNNVSRPDPDGNLVIENVEPGSYFLRMQTFRGYVSSMTSGGIDLLEHPLTVNPSEPPAPIDITLRDDTATLTGTVKPGDAALPQMSYVVLLPADGSSRFSQAFAGPDGTFKATNVPPGTYHLLAFPGQPFQIAYRDAEIMRRYDGKGLTITLAAGQSQQIDVPLMDRIEEE